ncbi:serine threonine kinase [Lecanosticta acicola]|uniref:non-specific serine/threonine protein kinase n=1 Tax=Lecanosticta acicola TaxID=111012 RepID=A0AAI8Z6K3_9PEZI|nr:serine threonine kinase [Lecanosticta acicola]
MFPSARRQNMPFVEESPAFQGRLNRRYIKFKIADGYALSEQLQGRTLFRKELTFHPPRVGNDLCQEARDEVRMLNIINGMHHPNIARMLFAFEEQDPLNQRISIVFRFNEFDLGRGILYRPVQQSAQILSRFDNAMQPPVPLEGILDHGLWKAMLGIVDAVKSLHEFHHPDIRPDRGDVIHAQHFDIKPANILVEIRNQRPAKLLLADFGRARLDEHPASQTTGQADAPATYDYAPPEADPSEEPSTGEIIMRRNYDVWSLGCVLLEVLVHLQTADAVGFLNARGRESRENHQDAAFWYRDQRHIPHLRSATETKLKALERGPQSNVERVAWCIRNMLSPDEAKRREWRIKHCLEALQPVERHSWKTMISTSKRALLDPELADMTTLCWGRNFQRSLPCNLFYFRDRTPSDTDEAILVAEIYDQPWNGKGLIKEEKIALIPFFEDRTLLSTPQSTIGTLSVAFHHLHGGEMLFHFQRVAEYLKFFAVLSHQQVALGSSSAGLDIRCQACELHIRRPPLPSRIESMGASRVQLWSTYDKRGYHQRFESQQSQLQPASASESGSSSSQRGSIAVAGDARSLPAAQNSRFKLALFTMASNSPSRAANTGMRAIIVELDRENIQLDSRAGDSRKVSFSRAGEHASFPVAVLEPSVKVASPSGPDEQYPGIPMSPAQLNELIRESKTRLKRLEIEFPERSVDRTNLLALLEHYRVF